MLLTSRDVKNIRTRGYPRILADNGYGYFLYLHVNWASTSIIVFVLVDTRIRYTLI